VGSVKNVELPSADFDLMKLEHQKGAEIRSPKNCQNLNFHSTNGAVKEHFFCGTCYQIFTRGNQ